MKPVYKPADIDNFKISAEQKKYILENSFNERQLKAHLNKLKRDYYKTCTPIGYI